MNAKHTPGPWTTRVLKTREQGEQIIGRDGELLATVHDIFFATQEEANARLIASAPELLEAAQAFLADFRDYINSDDYDLPDCGPLLAAISKATGEPVLDETDDLGYYDLTHDSSDDSADHVCDDACRSNGCKAS